VRLDVAAFYIKRKYPGLGYRAADDHRKRIVLIKKSMKNQTIDMSEISKR
jgi:hypothetical protein